MNNAQHFAVIVKGLTDHDRFNELSGESAVSNLEAILEDIMEHLATKYGVPYPDWKTIAEVPGLVGIWELTFPDATTCEIVMEMSEGGDGSLCLAEPRDCERVAEAVQNWLNFLSEYKANLEARMKESHTP
jgi:hypothetical protein